MNYSSTNIFSRDGRTQSVQAPLARESTTGKKMKNDPTINSYSTLQFSVKPNCHQYGK